MRRFTTVLALASALALSPAIVPVSAATKYSVTVTVDCYSSLEKVTIRNGRSRSITIRTVGSIYKPYSYEPFAVYRTLGAGKSITFRSGRGSGANKLTGNSIYNNSVGTKEGARVNTSVGTISDRC
jgi:hypothetical protein